MRTTLIPTLALVLAISSAVFVYLGTRARATPRSLILYSSLMLAYVAYLMLWRPHKLKSKLAKCWETYDLEVGPDYFLRRQCDLPDLRVQFNEVQTAERAPGRYLCVIGTPKSQVIAIPEGIENFAELLATVSAIHPVEERRLEQWQKTRLFMGAVLIAYVTMLWATNPVVVVPLSIGIAAVILWFFFWLRRNPNVPRRSKWFAWYFLLFLPLCAMKLLVAVASYLPHPPR